jgi:hypothetical protein
LFFIFKKRCFAISIILIKLFRDYCNEKKKFSRSYFLDELLPLALALGDIFKLQALFFKKSIQERAEAFALRVNDELAVLIAQSDADPQLRALIIGIRSSWRNYFNRLNNNNINI